MIGLCPLTWFSDETDSWWSPPVGVRSIIDLRPTADCAKRGEYGDFPHVLMVADAAPKADGWELLSDGDPRDLRVDQKLLDTWASLTGIAVQGDTLADVIWWHLTSNTDPKGLDRCKPLIPSRKNLELWSAGLIRSEPFTLSDAHANKVLAVIQDDYREVFELGQEGKAAADLHQKLLDDLCDKYAVSKTDRAAWEKFVPADLRTEIEGPKKRSTSYSENFDGSDSDTMGVQLTWAEQGGSDWDNESNRGVIDAASSSFCSCRAEHDLSSSDHYAQVVIVSLTGNYGPAARFSSSAQTLYSSEASGGIWRLIKFVSGGRTQLTSDEPGGGGTNRVRVAGSTITGYRNGTQYNSTTDTAISSGTRCGMFGRNNAGADISFDDWMCDDEVSGTSRGMPFGQRGTAFNGGRTLKGPIA